MILRYGVGDESHLRFVVDANGLRTNITIEKLYTRGARGMKHVGWLVTDRNEGRTATRDTLAGARRLAIGWAEDPYCHNCGGDVDAAGRCEQSCEVQS